MTTTVISKATIQPVSMEWTDAAIIQLLKDRDETGFERVFKHYFKSLYRYALTILQDHDQAEDIVQNVFYKLWDKIGSLHFSDSLAAYLYRAVHNESLNHLKHKKVRRTYQTYITQSTKDQAESAHRKVTFSELERRLQTAINELPEQCRTIFQMSRFEELRYLDIAAQLGISVKTVENQMGKALKQLRIKLVDYLPLIMLILLNILNQRS
ncbi:RNA polymerase sigma-70 factor [Flavitalea sp. BT771]|uniref:RNA polymerase sigma-70 factor n=1 Tax=Flavitalea sp. BT771 TaxID=3063329 RepID=UPI0026E37218|nr:RNA polymerase sigma-70 factor [Flavitalea sp. BT771]MDO6432319.1 RNA polymerase sigma-70 factor [Flavitalea sp. BT771]MDV6221229.1 RNA polymerase sigma-70 factor [Flavitalea sp. BT771]